MSKDHFEGKSVAEHLKEARAKGALATAEIHGTEMPGHLSAGADAAKETSLALLLLWMVLGPDHLIHFVLFSFGWLIWKVGRSAFLGWARLERLHRVIEEERWEIEHNRKQEKEELTALYAAKGLKGKLLDEVISVFMADDNRLLRIMLEEELGLTLEIYEHPLKQATGAAVGVILASAFFLLGAYLSPWGEFVTAALVMTAASIAAAKAERNRVIEAVIWNLSLAAFAAGAVYTLKLL